MIYNNLKKAYIVKYFAENGVRMNNDNLFDINTSAFDKKLQRMSGAFMKNVINPDKGPSAFYYRTGSNVLKITMRKQIRYGSALRNLITHKIDLYWYLLTTNYREYGITRMKDTFPELNDEEIEDCRSVFTRYSELFRDNIGYNTLSSMTSLLNFNIHNVHSLVINYATHLQYEHFIKVMGYLKDYGKIISRFEREELNV